MSRPTSPTPSRPNSANSSRKDRSVSLVSFGTLPNIKKEPEKKTTILDFDNFEDGANLEESEEFSNTNPGAGSPLLSSEKQKRGSNIPRLQLPSNALNTSSEDLTYRQYRPNQQARNTARSILSARTDLHHTSREKPVAPVINLSEVVERPTIDTLKIVEALFGLFDVKTSTKKYGSVTFNPEQTFGSGASEKTVANIEFNLGGKTYTVLENDFGTLLEDGYNPIFHRELSYEEGEELQEILAEAQKSKSSPALVKPIERRSAAATAAATASFVEEETDKGDDVTLIEREESTEEQEDVKGLFMSEQDLKDDLQKTEKKPRTVRQQPNTEPPARYLSPRPGARISPRPPAGPVPTGMLQAMNKSHENAAAQRLKKLRIILKCLNGAGEIGISEDKIIEISQLEEGDAQPFETFKIEITKNTEAAIWLNNSGGEPTHNITNLNSPNPRISKLSNEAATHQKYLEKLDEILEKLPSVEQCQAFFRKRQEEQLRAQQKQQAKQLESDNQRNLEYIYDVLKTLNDYGRFVNDSSKQRIEVSKKDGQFIVETRERKYLVPLSKDGNSIEFSGLTPEQIANNIALIQAKLPSIKKAQQLVSERIRSLQESLESSQKEIGNGKSAKTNDDKHFNVESGVTQSGQKFYTVTVGEELLTAVFDEGGLSFFDQSNEQSKYSRSSNISFLDDTLRSLKYSQVETSRPISARSTAKKAPPMPPGEALKAAYDARNAAAIGTTGESENIPESARSKLSTARRQVKILVDQEYLDSYDEEFEKSKTRNTRKNSTGNTPREKSPDLIAQEDTTVREARPKTAPSRVIIPSLQLGSTQPNAEEEPPHSEPLNELVSQSARSREDASRKSIRKIFSEVRKTASNLGSSAIDTITGLVNQQKPRVNPGYAYLAENQRADTPRETTSVTQQRILNQKIVTAGESSTVGMSPQRVHQSPRASISDEYITLSKQAQALLLKKNLPREDGDFTVTKLTGSDTFIENCTIKNGSDAYTINFSNFPNIIASFSDTHNQTPGQDLPKLQSLISALEKLQDITPEQRELRDDLSDDSLSDSSLDSSSIDTDYELPIRPIRSAPQIGMRAASGKFNPKKVVLVSPRPLKEETESVVSLSAESLNRHNRDNPKADTQTRIINFLQTQPKTTMPLSQYQLDNLGYYFDYRFRQGVFPNSITNDAEEVVSDQDDTGLGEADGREFTITTDGTKFKRVFSGVGQTERYTTYEITPPAEQEGEAETKYRLKRAIGKGGEWSITKVEVEGEVEQETDIDENIEMMLYQATSLTLSDAVENSYFIANTATNKVDGDVEIKLTISGTERRLLLTANKADEEQLDFLEGITEDNLDDLVRSEGLIDQKIENLKSRIVVSNDLSEIARLQSFLNAVYEVGKILDDVASTSENRAEVLENNLPQITKLIQQQGYSVVILPDDEEQIDNAALYNIRYGKVYRGTIKDDEADEMEEMDIYEMITGTDPFLVSLAQRSLELQKASNLTKKVGKGFLIRNLAESENDTAVAIAKAAEDIFGPLGSAETYAGENILGGSFEFSYSQETIDIPFPTGKGRESSVDERVTTEPRDIASFTLKIPQELGNELVDVERTFKLLKDAKGRHHIILNDGTPNLHPESQQPGSSFRKFLPDAFGNNRNSGLKKLRTDLTKFTEERRLLESEAVFSLIQELATKANGEYKGYIKVDPQTGKVSLTNPVDGIPSVICQNNSGRVATISIIDTVRIQSNVDGEEDTFEEKPRTIDLGEDVEPFSYTSRTDIFSLIKAQEALKEIVAEIERQRLGNLYNLAESLSPYAEIQFSNSETDKILVTKKEDEDEFIAKLSNNSYCLITKDYVAVCDSSGNILDGNQKVPDTLSTELLAASVTVKQLQEDFTKKVAEVFSPHTDAGPYLDTSNSSEYFQKFLADDYGVRTFRTKTAEFKTDSTIVINAQNRNPMTFPELGNHFMEVSRFIESEQDTRQTNIAELVQTVQQTYAQILTTKPDSNFPGVTFEDGGDGKLLRKFPSNNTPNLSFEVAQDGSIKTNRIPKEDPIKLHDLQLAQESLVKLQERLTIENLRLQLEAASQDIFGAENANGELRANTGKFSRKPQNDGSVVFIFGINNHSFTFSNDGKLTGRSYNLKPQIAPTVLSNFLASLRAEQATALDQLAKKITTTSADGTLINQDLVTATNITENGARVSSRSSDNKFEYNLVTSTEGEITGAEVKVGASLDNSTAKSARICDIIAAKKTAQNILDEIARKRFEDLFLEVVDPIEKAGGIHNYTFPEKDTATETGSRKTKTLFNANDTDLTISERDAEAAENAVDLGYLKFEADKVYGTLHGNYTLPLSVWLGNAITIYQPIIAAERDRLNQGVLANLASLFPGEVTELETETHKISFDRDTQVLSIVDKDAGNAESKFKLVAGNAGTGTEPSISYENDKKPSLAQLSNLLDQLQKNNSLDLYNKSAELVPYAKISFGPEDNQQDLTVVKNAANGDLTITSTGGVEFRITQNGQISKRQDADFVALTPEETTALRANLESSQEAVLQAQEYFRNDVKFVFSEATLANDAAEYTSRARPNVDENPVSFSFQQAPQSAKQFVATLPTISCIFEDKPGFAGAIKALKGPSEDQLVPTELTFEELRQNHTLLGRTSIAEQGSRISALGDILRFLRKPEFRDLATEHGLNSSQATNADGATFTSNWEKDGTLFQFDGYQLSTPNVVDENKSARLHDYKLAQERLEEIRQKTLEAKLLADLKKAAKSFLGDEEAVGLYTDCNNHQTFKREVQQNGHQTFKCDTINLTFDAEGKLLTKKTFEQISLFFNDIKRVVTDKQKEESETLDDLTNQLRSDRKFRSAITTGQDGKITVNKTPLNISYTKNADGIASVSVTGTDINNSDSVCDISVARKAMQELLQQMQQKQEKVVNNARFTANAGRGFQSIDRKVELEAARSTELASQKENIKLHRALDKLFNSGIYVPAEENAANRIDKMTTADVTILYEHALKIEGGSSVKDTIENIGRNNTNLIKKKAEAIVEFLDNHYKSHEEGAQQNRQESMISNMRSFKETSAKIADQVKEAHQRVLNTISETPSGDVKAAFAQALKEIQNERG